MNSFIINNTTRETPKTYFIGDVHGCFDELMLLIEKIKLTPKDALYFVGDIVNKGPKSREVVEWIRSRPNTFAIQGNHEFFGMRSKEEIAKIHKKKVEEITWDEVKRAKFDDLQKNLGTDNVEWLKNLPIYIEKKEWIMIHGGVHPEYGLDTPPEIATTIRNEYNGKPWYEYYKGEKPIIYGHWSVDGLRIRKNTIGLDTGCCFGGHLTAYCFETGDFWQVRAIDLYGIIPNWKETVSHV